MHYPVYFFKLHGISTVEEFLSKILGIFKSNLVDHGLKPIDKVVSIFREISSPIFVVFDNLDDLLSSESHTAKLRNVFQELLDSNVNISIMFTTRELLENLRGYIESFQAIRIGPLHPVSSIKFVRQILAAFSENVVCKVAQICSHVPLAIKLVASFVRNNTEDLATKMLEELSHSGDLLGKINSPYEENMKKLFELLFKQLTLSDKHALISLTVFSSSKICKNAAVEVVSGEIGVTEAVRSLKTLVNKSFTDEDSSGENYSIHPLIYSFVEGKAKEIDFENILNSSNTRFCRYYLLLFEKINDDFLAGKPIDSPQLQDTIEHLSIAIHQSLTSSFQDLIRMLSKCEIFLFFIGLPWASFTDIPKMYNLAIEKCSTQGNDCSSLYVSRYFRSIMSSFFVSHIDADIPEQIREHVMLSSGGSSAKLGCYEGISLIVKGERKSGVERIEKHLDYLESRPDQQLIKCLCLQLLALYYTDLKDRSKTGNFCSKAIEVCDEIGNYNLFFIRNCEQFSLPVQDQSKGEQLILFVHLLFSWSRSFVGDGTRMRFLNLLHRLEQQLEKKPVDNSRYIFAMVTYCDYILAVLRNIAGQGFLLDEKINFLDKCLKSHLTDRTFLRLSEVGHELPSRLLHCYSMKMAFHNNVAFPKRKSLHNVEIETCRNALDLSLRLNGKQDEETVSWYLNMGLAEATAENYIAALDAFEQVLKILNTGDEKNNGSHDILATAYFEKGVVCSHLNKFELALESFEEALKIRRKLFAEDSYEILEVLGCLGNAQLNLNKLNSALATHEQALEIVLKLHAVKCCRVREVIMFYFMIAQVHQRLGNNTECLNVLKTVLEMETDWNDKLIQCYMFSQFINFNVDESLHMKFFKVSHANREEYYPMLVVIRLKLAAKQLTSGKCKDGLASLLEALNIKLDETLMSHFLIREVTFTGYLEVATILVNTEKSKLAKRAIDRATKIAESLPECKKHLYVFLCYSLKGRIHNEMQEYVAAIESLDQALLQLPKFSPDAIGKSKKFRCHIELAKAYCYEMSFENALTSLYDALSIIKDLFPEGSEGEGDLYFSVAAIANRMKNKSLQVNNLRLAYKMYSKILGGNHSVTEECYIAYARALINC